MGEQLPLIYPEFNSSYPARGRKPLPKGRLSGSKQGSIPLTPQGDGNNGKSEGRRRKDERVVCGQPDRALRHQSLLLILNISMLSFHPSAFLLLPFSKSHYPARGRKRGLLFCRTAYLTVQISLPRKGTETVSKDEGRRMKDEKLNG